MWHSLFIGSVVDALEPIKHIRNAFVAAVARSTDARHMAMFCASGLDSEHEVSLFFSPAAEEFARSVHAVACDKPAFRGLSLLAGDKRCWSVLFPGERYSLKLPGTPDQKSTVA